MRRSKKNIIILLLLCGCYQYFYGQQDKKIDSLLSVLNSAGHDTVKMKTLIAISKTHFFNKDYTPAIQYAQSALAIAQKLKNKNEERNGFYSLGKCYTALNQFEEARKNYYAAIKIKDELGDKNRGDEYYELAVTHHWESNYPETLKFLLKALDDYKKGDDKNMVAETYAFIGGTNAEFGNMADGDKYMILALKLHEELGNQEKIANTLIEKSKIDSWFKRDTLALNNCFKALRIYQELDNEGGVAFANHNIARILVGQGVLADSFGNSLLAQEKYKLAEKYQLPAVKFYEKNQVDWMLIAPYLRLGALYMRMHSYSRARYYLEKSNRFALESKNKFDIWNTYLRLARLDSAQGNFRSAFENYKRYVLYKDSVVNEESSKKMLSAKMQNDFDKKEDLLKQKQLLTEIQVLSQQKQKYFYLIGAILLGLLSIFVFLNFRNQKRINRLSITAYAKEKAELELHSLRAQLNPHFMFNSLNAIQELILREDFDNSHTYLARFAKLVRMLLENADRPFVQLNREVDFLELYLSLEKLRIPDLEFSITVDSSINSNETLLPNMVLQPYIENALWHGLSQKKGDKKLGLVIHQQNGAVVYDVKDNGVGRKKAAEFKSLYRKEHKSKGMELLTRRFKLLNEEFGSEIKTYVTDVMENNEPGGTVVSIVIPKSISASGRNQLQ